MNGLMTLPMARGRYYTVYGGPYKKRPAEINGVPTLGVKMAEEIKAAAHVAVDVVDFSIPTFDQVDDALEKIVDLILSGRPVYVGCMGGIGRTGLMLAILAKTWGIEDPVTYVRAQYIPHAVETTKQQKFVAEYKPRPEVLSKLRWARFLSFFRWNESLTLSART